MDAAPLHLMQFLVRKHNGEAVKNASLTQHKHPAEGDTLTNHGYWDECLSVFRS